MDKHLPSYSIDCNMFKCGCNLQKSPEVPRTLIFSLRSNITYLLHVCQSDDWNLKISVKRERVALNMRFIQRRTQEVCYKLATFRLSWLWPLTSWWPSILGLQGFLLTKSFFFFFFVLSPFLICSQQDALIFGASNVHIPRGQNCSWFC